MDKVNCLKKLLSCINGQPVNEISGTTVCEMIEQFCQFYDNGGTEDVSDKFQIIPASGDSTITDGVVEARRTGSIHCITISGNLVINAMSSTPSPFGLAFDSVGFNGAVGVCMISNESGISGGVMEIVASETAEHPVRMCFSTSGIATGTYNLKCQFTFTL